MADPDYQAPSPATGIPVLGRWPTEAELPCEDDQPLAETDYQLEPLTYAYFGLKWAADWRIGLASLTFVP